MASISRCPWWEVGCSCAPTAISQIVITRLCDIPGGYLAHSLKDLIARANIKIELITELSFPSPLESPLNLNLYTGQIQLTSAR